MGKLPEGVPRWNRSLQGLARPAAIGPARTSFGLPPEPPPASQPQGAEGAVLNVFPWWLYKTGSSKDFLTRNLSFVIPASTANFAAPGVSFQVPQGFLGVVQQLKVLVQNPNVGIDVFVTLLRSQTVVPGWDSYAFLPAAVTTEVAVENDLQVRLAENDLLAAQFTNNNVTPWTIGIQLQGWITPIEDIRRLQGPIKY